MWKDLLGFFTSTPFCVILVVVGGILMLVTRLEGRMCRVKFEKAHWLFAVFGALVIVLGIFIYGYFEANPVANAIDCEDNVTIERIFPPKDQKIKVRGSFKILPAGSKIVLYNEIRGEEISGDELYPFVCSTPNSTKGEWEGTIYYAKNTKLYSIAVGIAGKAGQKLIKYYEEVQRATGQNVPLKEDWLPPDSKICQRKSAD